MGVEHILKLMDALKLVGCTGVKIGADGKVNFADLKFLLEAIQNINVVMGAVAGADEALKESKEIDQAEAALLVAKVFELVQALKDAKK